MRTFYLGAVSALLLTPLSSLAADNTTDEIVVTATRTAQTADASLASVSIITRADIERSQAGSVAELLTGEIGVDSSVNGGYGKFTSLFVRGTNSNHVLVLIDGMRVGSATVGTYSSEFLPLDEVERIEIVRGPRSSLYGSEAVGGVIQIFTRKGGEKFNAQAEAGYGSYRTGKVAAGMSGNQGGTFYSLHASRFNTRGFDAQQNNAPNAYGLTANEPDKDGYLNDAYSLQLGHRFNNNTELSTTFLNSQGNTEYDGYYDSTDFLQQAWGVKFGLSALANWRMNLSAGRSKDESSNFKSQVFQSLINTERQVAAWQNDISLGTKRVLTLGADYQQDTIVSSSTYSQTSRDNVGVYGQYQETIGPVSLLLGLRSDNDQAFGRHSTGNVALGYAASNRLRMTASYGTAFKAPTFNDLYWPYTSETYFGTTYVSQGNPGLQPEESQSTELGASYKLSPDIKLQLNAFRTRIDNLIDWATSQTGPSTYTSSPQNIASALIDGIETRIDGRMAGWDSHLGYTWLDPRDNASDKVLPRRARSTLKLQLDRAIGKMRLGASWLLQSYRYDDKDNLIRLGGYGIAGVHAQYDFGRHWWLRVKADNVFDKKYETADTYNSAGRSLFLSAGTQWQ